ALGVSPILVLLTRANRQIFRRSSREVRELESSALSVIQEVLSAVRVVKAFGQEEREQQRFVSRSSAGMWARIRFAFLQGSFDLLMSLTIAIGTAAVLFTGILHVEARTLTLGSLLLVMGYLAQLYAPLQLIGRKLASLQGNLASAERAFAVLDMPPDVPERPDARRIGRARGALAFRGVSFAYTDDRPVLREITFDVRSGMRVGIVGTTGA